MAATPPRSLIINSPFERPSHHWLDEHGTLALRAGRRSAGYDVFDPRHNTRRTEPLELVNRIRERVDAWRADDYRGATTVTRALLEHWHDTSARQHPFYFCQLEAIETQIWWVEAAAEHRQGIAVSGDGGPWSRTCAKMATGAGKTAVMAMAITWQTLNALTYPKRTQAFSRSIFVVAPGITVKERLQVLRPGHPANVYDEFRLCPSEGMRHKLNGAEVLIENWHTLMPLKEPERGVVKKGAESDVAFVRRVLGPLATRRDLLVLNDEATTPTGSRPTSSSAALAPRRKASTRIRRRAGSKASIASTPCCASPAASTCRRRRSRPPAAPTPSAVCSAGSSPTSASTTPSRRAWSRRRGWSSATASSPTARR